MQRFLHCRSPSPSDDLPLPSPLWRNPLPPPDSLIQGGIIATSLQLFVYPHPLRSRRTGWRPFFLPVLQESGEHFLRSLWLYQGPTFR